MNLEAYLLDEVIYYKKLCRQYIGYNNELYDKFKNKLEFAQLQYRDYYNKKHPNWKKERDAAYKKNHKPSPIPRMSDWTENFEEYGDSPNN